MSKEILKALVTFWGGVAVMLGLGLAFDLPRIQPILLGMFVGSTAWFFILVILLKRQ